MIAGMLVVYVFLSVLLLAIKISARFFGASGQGAGPSAGGEMPPSTSTPTGGDGRVAAVISAAVAAYKSKKG